MNHSSDCAMNHEGPVGECTCQPKTVAEMKARSSFAQTRGRAAAMAAGLRDENQINAFLLGAAWMGEEIHRVYNVQVKPEFAMQSDANQAVKG